MFEQDAEFKARATAMLRSVEGFDLEKSVRRIGSSYRNPRRAKSLGEDLHWPASMNGEMSLTRESSSATRRFGDAAFGIHHEISVAFEFHRFDDHACFVERHVHCVQNLRKSHAGSGAFGFDDIGHGGAATSGSGEMRGEISKTLDARRIPGGIERVRGARASGRTYVRIRGRLR